MVSGVIQANLDNMNINPNDTFLSQVDTEAHDVSNSFGGRNKAQISKKRNNNEWNLSTTTNVHPTICLFKIQGRTSSNFLKTNDYVQIYSLYLKDALDDRTTYYIYELDEHADTCYLDSNFMLVHDTGRRYEVLPYNTVYDHVSIIKVVSDTTTYMDSVSNTTFILWIYEAFFFGKDISHPLINPN